VIGSVLNRPQYERLGPDCAGRAGCVDGAVSAGLWSQLRCEAMCVVDVPAAARHDPSIQAADERERRRYCVICTLDAFRGN
jgi:hypothetical protein